MTGPDVPPNGAPPPNDATGRPRSVGRMFGQAAAPGRSGAQVAPQPGPEADVWSGRTSWKYFTGRVLLWALAVTGLAVLAGFGSSRLESITKGMAIWTIVGVGGFSGVGVWGGIALRVFNTSYRLTSQRLFITRGILSHTVDQTELIRVDDVRMFKSLWGRLLNVGSVTVITTDATDRNVLIEGVSNPDQVAEAIRFRMRALRERSVYVESL